MCYCCLFVAVCLLLFVCWLFVVDVRCSSFLFVCLSCVFLLSCWLSVLVRRSLLFVGCLLFAVDRR